MAKLTGTNPDQVPTNADLGTMAYQDAERPALGQTNVKSAGTALIVERTGDDGQILDLRKDGSTVGSIGTSSSYMVIGSPVGSDAHLLIGNNLVHPATSTGSAKDASIDIGGSSNRFRDLYLSGGVTGGSSTRPARFSHGKDDYITLADDAILNLHEFVAGSLIISIYDRNGGRGGVFHATFTGGVTQIAANGPWATTSDTDGSYCVYKAGGSHAVYFKNRIGSSGTFQVSIFAAEC